MRLFFLVFASPLFFYLKDTRKKVTTDVSFIKVGFKRVYYTITHLKDYKTLSTFLLAFFFYIEGVNTVIFFAGNYAATTLKFSQTELVLFFLIVQTTAIFGSVLFGILADSIGQKKSLVLSLIIWIGIILFAFISSDIHGDFVVISAKYLNVTPEYFIKLSFYVVGLGAGSVMGATQSTSRSMMSRLTPEEKKTEFFGFFSFFGKSSAILGPFVFGVVSYLTGSQRFAITSIGIFFIIGLAILNFVNDIEPQKS